MTRFADIEDRRYGSGLAGISNDWSNDQAKFPASFPITRWTSQWEKYQDYWRYFTGEVWEETIPGQKSENGGPVFRYPLKINYIKTICLKHNQALWGETDGVKGPLVRMQVSPRSNPDGTPPPDDAKKRALELEDFFNLVLEENNTRVLFREAGLVSQFLGGSVINIRWEPDDIDLETGIRLECTLPDFFLPVWDTSNNKLIEIFKVWRMPAREAELTLGVAGGSNYVIYVEHWTENQVTITVDGKPLEYTFNNGEQVIYNGLQNVFGFVPAVYIPRMRCGSGYGMSLVEDLAELSKELNARMADMGDIINGAARQDIYMKNITSVKRRDIPGGNRQAIELVGNSTITGMEPKVETISPPSLPGGLIDFPKLLREQLMLDAAVPPVAEGVDEGSQRSGLTLAFRMWAMTSTVEAQRDHWTTGLIRLSKMMARIAILKGIGGITEEHLKGVEISCQWPSIMPRDREAFVNEVMLSLNSGILSPLSALEKLGSVADAAEEYKRVQDHIEWMKKTEAKYAGGASAPDKKATNNIQLNEPVVVPGTKD